MLEKELETIVLGEKDILPFLKKLTPEDKRALVPFLKKFKEKVFEHKQIEKKYNGGISYTLEPSHTQKQRDLVIKACFVCYNKTDARRASLIHQVVSDEYIKNIIPLYTPKWYGDLINEQMPWGMPYEKIMALHKKGVLQPSQALILAKLPSAITEIRWKKKRSQSFYNPEILLKHKETLEEHVWYLFEGESSINNYYNYLHLENYKNGNDIWIDTILNLTNENKLDRERVLIATIYTATKGFNKTLSGWFYDLLIKLNPSKEEVLKLQNELFTALNSPYSKVVNTVLKYLKLVANQKAFKHEDFIQNASTLLSAETKSIVNSTLILLDKVAKANKTSSIAVCKKAAEALINVDEKIQLRAAKIIHKYGDAKDQELLEELSLYADNIFHSSREVLKEYIIFNEAVEEEVYEVESPKITSKENELSKLESLDDLIFFISQVIDNNEVYHIDLLLSYLPKLYTLLTKDSVAKLEPIFKRSFDLSMSFGWNSRVGYLEYEAAYYINDFAEILMKEYPNQLESFKKIKAQKIAKLKEERFYNSHYKERLKEIEHRPVPDYIYQIHRLLFVKSKSFIKKRLALELLSTPTHAPCWVAPEVLIDRIIAFEKENEGINLFDFQIAIGRLPIHEYPPEMIKKVDEIKDKEINKILKYHFNQLDIQKEEIARPELWIQSVLSKNRDADVQYFQEYLANPLQKEMGLYDWDCKIRDHFYRDYNYTTRKYEQKKGIKKELKFKGFDTSQNETGSIVSNIIGLFNKKKKTVRVNSIYQYMYFKKQMYATTIEPKDDVKFLFLSPNNPGMFLSHVIHHNLNESTFLDKSSGRNMVNLLKGLYELWYRADFKESTYLFLAAGLLCSDKVARELAAEIWINANAVNKINNEQLGQILGKLESGEYAPLKRFTDLLTARLFNISKQHNQALFSLLDHMISHMNHTPIRGIKKLLEIYLELKLTFPQIEINQLAQERLESWKQTNSLKTLINKMI